MAGHKPKPGFTPPPDPNARYRVRDRHGKDAPGYLWGEDLSFEEAERLKERVNGSGKSKTARYEEMSVPYPPVEHQEKAAATLKPSPMAPFPFQKRVPAPKPAIDPATLERLRGERQKDPHLEQMRQVALGAAHGAAAEAQARADKIAAEKKLADDAAKLAEAATEAEEDGLTDGELSDLLGGVDAEPTDEEIAEERARIEAESEAQAASDDQDAAP